MKTRIVPPGSDPFERGRRGSRRADHDRVDRRVRFRSGAARISVEREHVVAAAREHRCEQPADESLPEHEHASRRHRVRSAHDARERLERRRLGVAQPGGKIDPRVRAHPFRETAGTDRRCGELLARRLVAGAAALAFAAAAMVDERDAPSVFGLADHLVPEDGARELGAQLLHVRAAQPAREHAHELAGPVGLVDVAHLRAPRRVE